MTFNLRLGLIIVFLLLMIVVIKILKKGRIPVKYSLVWIMSGFIILLVGVIPSLFECISRLFGFVTMANMVVGIFIFILLMITISLTVMIAGQKKKTTILIQEISLLKHEVEKNAKVSKKI